MHFYFYRIIISIRLYFIACNFAGVKGARVLIGDKNGWFKKGIAKRTKRMCRDVGRAIGPDRFVSGNNYWQSHAVLETQESIVARSDDSLPGLLHPAVVASRPRFFLAVVSRFFGRQERVYILISAISNYPHKIRIERNIIQLRDAMCNSFLHRAKIYIII